MCHENCYEHFEKMCHTNSHTTTTSGSNLADDLAFLENMSPINSVGTRAAAAAATVVPVSDENISIHSDKNEEHQKSCTISSISDNILDNILTQFSIETINCMVGEVMISALDEGRTRAKPNGPKLYHS